MGEEQDIPSSLGRKIVRLGHLERVSWMFITLALILAPILICFNGVAFASDLASDEPIVFFSILVVDVGIILALVLGFLIRRARSVTIYEDGLRYRNWFKTRTTRWDQVTALDIRYGYLGDKLVLGFFRLELTGDRPLNIPRFGAGTGSVYYAVSAGASKFKLTDFARRVAEGETLSFGEVTLDRDALKHGKRVIPIREVEEVIDGLPSEPHLKVRVAGKKRPVELPLLRRPPPRERLTAPGQTVPHAHVLPKLLRLMVDAHKEAAQSLGQDQPE